MSSILYAEVIEKRGDTLSLLLVEIQFGFVFVSSPTLALQLLVESWQMMRDGWVVTALEAATRGGLYCPFPLDEARRRATASPIATINPDLADEGWFAANADRYIISTGVTGARYAGGLRGAPTPGRHYFGPRARCEFRIQVADVG